jgi:hypothetical protein
MCIFNVFVVEFFFFFSSRPQKVAEQPSQPKQKRNRNISDNGTKTTATVTDVSASLDRSARLSLWQQLQGRKQLGTRRREEGAVFDARWGLGTSGGSL